MRNAPETAVHGTVLANYASIRANGLHRGLRQHIHFVDGEAVTAASGRAGERSGLRNGSELMIWVDLRWCLRDGISFYKSHNRVLLTPGQDGWLLPKYIFQVQIVGTDRAIQTPDETQLPTVDMVKEALQKARGKRTPRQSREKRPAKWYQLHTCPPNPAQTRKHASWIPFPNCLNPCCTPPGFTSYLPALHTKFPHAQVFGCIATRLEVGSDGVHWSLSRAGAVMPCLISSTCIAALRGPPRYSRVASIHSSSYHHLLRLPYMLGPLLSK